MVLTSKKTENIMAIRLVAADLDGTLLNSQKTISPGTQRAITRAQAAGIHFAVSTGRMLCECGDILAALPQVRYISCSSGACVLDLVTHETIYEACLTPLQAYALYTRLKDFGGIFCYFTGGRIYCDAALWRTAGTFLEPWAADYIHTFYLPVENFEAFLQQNTLPVEKLFLMFSSQNERDAAWDAVRELPLYIATSAPVNLEITAAQANKGAGLDALRRYLGLDRSQVMAVGDSENDLRMLGYAAVPVVMANAADEIKSIAALIAPSNDDDGVAWVLDKLVEGAL